MRFPRISTETMREPISPGYEMESLPITFDDHRSKAMRQRTALFASALLILKRSSAGRRLSRK